MGSASNRLYGYLAFTFFFIFLVSTQLVYVKGQKTAILTGTVLDENQEPIRNAVIRVTGPGNMFASTETDSSGNFQLSVNRDGTYSVFAMYDEPETSGIDYVPSLWTTYLQLGSRSAFTFTLERGASLYIEEEIRFVESSKPADYCSFTVVHPNGEPLSGKYSIYTYGIGTDIVRRYGFDQKLVVIPAEKEVAIRVDASISLPKVSHSLVVKGKPGYFRLSQGEMLSIASMEYVLAFNAEKMKQTWDSALYQLKGAEYIGFLVSAERQDLLDAYRLIDEALLLMKKGSLQEAFSRLRNAYILTSNTIGTLQGLIQISSYSVFLLVPIFVFIASSSAYLVTERENCVEMFSREKKIFSVSINLLISLLFYSLLICTFYLAYPGCRLISQSAFFAAAISVFTLGQIAVSALQPMLEGKGGDRSIQFGSSVVIAFSMACRNLRRRKMRTILSLANLMIMIFGFITFTSISTGFGLITISLQPSIPEHAILVKDRLIGSDEPFLPLPSSLPTWLEDQPNVTLVSPKAENIPMGSFGDLYTRSGDKIVVRGVLGIKRSTELNFTRIDEVLVSGAPLQDDDLNGILICSLLSKTFHVDVGDKLYGFGREFTIRGFFDKRAIETLKDVDGQLFIPFYVNPSGMIIHCSGEEAVILTYNASLSLPRVALSRVNLQLRDQSLREYSEFAQMVALSREYHVYVSQPDSLHLLYVGSYVEEKGAGLIPFLMILVMLNVSTMMMGSVSERKTEISSLSSVGLNPTHISALFIAEAAVIGFIGGGLGYLLGILGYRTVSTTWLGALQVREKVSAEWGLIALLISGLTAIIASMSPALKASTIVTPSLLRKWSIGKEEKPSKTGQPWVLDLPVKLAFRELEPFTGFILKRMLERRVGMAGYMTNVSLKEEEAESGPPRRITFKYTDPQQPDIWSKNELVIRRTEGKDFFEAKLLCIPSMNSQDIVHKTTTYVRSLIFEWNAIEFEVATPYDPSLSHLYTLVNAYNPTSLYIATTQPITDEKLNSLTRRLIEEGLRPPRIVISKVDPLDIEQCMKIAEDLVSRADVVCISGEPEALCTALAIKATTHNKMICSIVDPRPMELRMKDPFQNLKIVNVQIEKS